MSRQNKRSFLISIQGLLVAIVALAAPSIGWAQGVLDTPGPSSVQSGIGLIAGWVCEADSVTIEIDDLPPLEAAYGTTRADTQDVCGDDNNGFGLTFNWNLLGEGLHRVRVLVDGEELSRVAFTVVTLGLGEFPQGLVGEATITDFPEVDMDVGIVWQESLQSFVLRGESDSGGGGSAGVPPMVLDNPQPGSFQGGVGLISGFVCEADSITIEIDDLPPLEAAYGTTRADTQDACGDDDNGFGLTFNWNLVGDGEHTVRALADGVEFANVTFTVATLGLGEFPQGLEDRATALGVVPDFPTAGTDARVRWQDSQQNFIVEGILPPEREDGLCDTQESEAFDTNGQMAIFKFINICPLNGGTMRLDVNYPIQQPIQQQGQAKEGEVFLLRTESLSFMQGGVTFTADDFQWLDGQGNDVSRDLREGETLETLVQAEEDVPLNFGLPFQAQYNQTAVVGFGGCGDGMVNLGEECDGNDLGEGTCQSQGFFKGTLSCGADCTFDTSGCNNCGNGSVDSGEECDGSNLNGQSCQSLGFPSGSQLRCTSNCTFFTRDCGAPGAPGPPPPISSALGVDAAWQWLSSLLRTGREPQSLNHQ